MSKNKLKSEKPETKKSRNNDTDANVLKKDKEPEVKVKELVKDERTHKVLGMICLLLSVYFFIAFTSYLFTWQEDQDKVFRYSGSLLFNTDIKVDNLLGRLGAFVSHWFFYSGFGLASYFFCYLCFILGINFIVGRRVFRIWRNIKHILFGLLFLSTAMSFIAIHDGFPWGGALGDGINKWTTGFIGKTGTALLLLVTGLSWLVWKFNFDFKWPERKPRPPKPVPQPVPVVETPAPATGKRKNGLKGDKGDTGVMVIPPPAGEEQQDDMQLVERNDTSGITYIPPAAAQVPFAVEAAELEAETAAREEAEEEEEVEPLLYIEETIEAAAKKKRNQPPEEVAFEIKSMPRVEEEEIEEDIELVREPVHTDPYDPMLDLRDYQYPGLELLDTHNNEKIIQDAAELEKNKNQIIDTLKNYDISIQKISATVGPTVTLYEIVPAAGVR
ncbi:MAG TPA: DNA translocase FtsK 4TM domain-containing protein, partial [Chitinophaga sp.]